MNLFASLALLASVASATPLIPRANNSAQSTSQNFHLKTSNADQDVHNDLYVYAYHTGAGLNDAVLSPDAGQASRAFLNNTAVQFDLDTPFPWGMQMVGATDYGCKHCPVLFLFYLYTLLMVLWCSVGRCQG